MNIEKMREEFEAWVKSEWPQTSLNRCDAEYSHSIGQYVAWEVECCWRSWQASRATIEVELPDAHKAYSGDHHPFMFADEVVSAIESLGLKVKS